MRPRHKAAEYAMTAASATTGCTASMRPRHKAAEYAVQEVPRADPPVHETPQYQSDGGRAAPQTQTPQLNAQARRSTPGTQVPSNTRNLPLLLLLTEGQDRDIDDMLEG